MGVVSSFFLLLGVFHFFVLYEIIINKEQKNSTKLTHSPLLFPYLTTAVSRRHGTPDGDDGDNEPMWSLELASLWVRFDATCGSHALGESEPLITTALAMLPPQRPTVARAGCVAEARSNIE
jgi:hypothetical protein